MAPPRPKANTPQKSKLTAELRRVCKDYPEGAIVLRELLQNADDAGAHDVRFVLDTREHPTPALCKGLADYQGPALLIYNDATFREDDFVSLTSLGDSLKRKDPKSTGKFGLGFSSVYNWTDSPAILSGSTLLFLDPHEKWSAEPEVGAPGGPQYDFQAGLSTVEMRNQLHGFSSIASSITSAYDGTIIRLPLRTAIQAKSSDIKNKPATIESIKTSFDMFSKEMRTNGLLFLKSVRQVSIQVDSQPPHVIEIDFDKAVDTASAHNLYGLLDRMHSGLLKQPEYTCRVASVNQRTADTSSTVTYGIVHLVHPPHQDDQVDHWAKENKHFPWVAAAAPLQETKERGRIFSVLPLSMHTGFSIHVHGLFAITADRSSFERHNDDGVLDKSPNHWNKFLSRKLIPLAWKSLLVSLAVHRPESNLLHAWPFHQSTESQEWDNMRMDVFTLLSKDTSKVWKTPIGLVSTQHVVLAPVSLEDGLKNALRETRVPIVYLKESVLADTRMACSDRQLGPFLLATHLKGLSGESTIAASVATTLLAYILEECTVQEIAGLCLFPFKDGKRRALSSVQQAFLTRDDIEDQVFKAEKCNTIDLSVLPPRAATTLQDYVAAGGKLLKYRTSADLAMSISKAIYRASGDMYKLSNEQETMVADAWAWIAKHSPQGPLEHSLPLVPLRDGSYRVILPKEGVPYYIFNHGPSSSIAELLAARSQRVQRSIVMNDQRASALLRAVQAEGQSSHLICGDSFEAVIAFLSQHLETVNGMPQQAKYVIFGHLAKLTDSSKPYSVHTKDMLRSLPVFSTLSWASGGDVSVQLASLQTANEVYGVSRDIPIACRARRVLLDFKDESLRHFATSLGLATHLDHDGVIQRCVIPDLASSQCDGVFTSEIRHTLASKIMDSLRKIPSNLLSSLKITSFIPLDNGQEFAAPSSIINPEAYVPPARHSLTRFFDEDELLRPHGAFVARYGSNLKDVGAVSELNADLVIERIQAYAAGKPSSDAKIELLLKAFLPLALRSNEAVIKVARSAFWLPTRSADGKVRRCAASECRASMLSDVVGRALHILSFDTDPSWVKVLGWDTKLPLWLLLANLDKILGQSQPDLHELEAVLHYMIEQYHGPELLERLKTRAFIPCWGGRHVQAIQAYSGRFDAQPLALAPYLYQILPVFWNNFKACLGELGVPSEGPDKPRLEYAANEMRQVKELEATDIDVAISLARLWVQHCDAKNALIPTSSGRLLALPFVYFPDIPVGDDFDRPLSHKRVSREVAEDLGLDLLSRMMLREHIGISDEDDEFFQREEVVDGIRSDLDRYRLDASLFEYVSNADDCGSASQVNLMLDMDSHPTDQLLDPELKVHQGPGLLIHNDGVFTEADFEGIKYVGRGSKRDNATSIGKFGRGHRVMYHFTDCPMILSGSRLLILDPLQKFLPLNVLRKQRKPGVLIDFKKLRGSLCKDQLAPFVGKFGFDPSKDYYEGTIFRFPLRPDGTTSDLMETVKCLDAIACEKFLHDFFNDASITLLFMRRIQRLNCFVGAKQLWTVIHENGAQDLTSESASPFAQTVMKTIDVRKGETQMLEESQRWLRGLEDIVEIPLNLVGRHKRRMKETEVGLAFCLDSKAAARPGRFFNCVPMKFNTTWPVHVHATFLVSGDRQNIFTEESADDAGADWNRWLLKEAIPDFYFAFLSEIGRRVYSETLYSAFPVRRQSSVGERGLCRMIADGFWGKMASTKHQIFPATAAAKAENSTMLPAQKQARRKVATLLQPKDATFKADPSSLGTDPLTYFLASTLETLVTPPSSVIPIDVLKSGELQLVTPELVRMLLRSKVNSVELKSFADGDAAFLDALHGYILPRKDETFSTLHDCTLIPLQDSTFTEVRLHDFLPEDIVFRSNENVRSLFGFAGHRFVSSIKTEARSTVRLLDCLTQHNPSTNVQQFSIKYVAHVLAAKKEWTADRAGEAWHKKFWSFLNGAKDVDQAHIESLKNFPLIIVRSAGNIILRSVEQYRKGFMLIDSADEAVSTLLRKFPELEMVDKDVLPINESMRHAALEDEESLHRLICQLAAIAQTCNLTIEELVRQRTEPVDLIPLRNAMLKFESAIIGMDQAQALPVWKPRFPLGNKPLLSSREALTAHSPGLLVPWMQDSSRFASDIPAALHRPLLSNELLKKLILPSLPQKLTSSGVGLFVKFISALSVEVSRTTESFSWLKAYRLAPDQNNVLRFPYELYDHEDTVFTQAFACVDPSTSAHFLAPSFHQFRSMFITLGLRNACDGIYQPADYINAVSTFASTLAGPTPEPTAETRFEAVLRPLRIEYANFRTWHSKDWNELAALEVFPVSAVPSHARGYQRAILAALPHSCEYLTMAEIILPEYKDVCWLTHASAEWEPSASTIRCAGLSGKPGKDAIWNHLRNLAGFSSIITPDSLQAYMRDVTHCYDYLEKHHSAEKRSSMSEQIWCNISDADLTLMSITQLRPSWTSLDKLILDSPCDAQHLKRVGPFLERFSRLLKGQGCQSITHPAIHIEPAPTGNTAIGNELAECRRKDFLTDMVLKVVTADGQSTMITAHRAVLAVRSDYFKARFSGNWSGFEDEQGRAVVEELDSMPDAVARVIEWCYDQPVPWLTGPPLQEEDIGNSDAIADKLDRLLSVLQLSSKWLIAKLHQQVQRQILQGAKFFVRLDTVREVREEAFCGGGEDIVRHCDEYMASNALAVRLANDDQE